MFSGIIDAIGHVRACDPSPAGRRLRIHAERYWAGLHDGASIALDGVCLTVVHHDDHDAEFDVVAETLRKTTLGNLKPGHPVNLQKSLAAGDRIDGHFVQGHVDATALISRIDRASGESMWWFEAGPDAMSYIVAKGSIAIDGISLTVASIEDPRFAVALIPTTLQKTTLGKKRTGDRVNIETDILARTVIHHLRSMGADPAGPRGALTPESKLHRGFA